MYAHNNLHCLENIINQPNKSTQVIVRQPGDYKGTKKGLIVKYASKFIKKQSIYVTDSGY